MNEYCVIIGKLISECMIFKLFGSYSSYLRNHMCSISQFCIWFISYLPLYDYVLLFWFHGYNLNILRRPWDIRYSIYYNNCGYQNPFYFIFALDLVVLGIFCLVSTPILSPYPRIQNISVYSLFFSEPCGYVLTQ